MRVIILLTVACLFSACSQGSGSSGAGDNSKANSLNSPPSIGTDQYGRELVSAGPTNSCVDLIDGGYTYSNGEYFSPAGPGSPCGNLNVLPSVGYSSSQYVSGGIGACATWSQFLSSQYVPMNLGEDKIICVLFSFAQSYGAQFDAKYNSAQSWFDSPPSVYPVDYTPENSSCANVVLRFSPGVKVCF